jgi:AcrR family transcriptional regulator
VSAAGELFSQHGTEAVSVRQIASRVGVSHTLVHKYCGSKEDIVRLVLSARDREYTNPLGQIADFREALKETTRALLSGRQQPRTMMYLALEGRASSQVGGGWPAMHLFLERLERGTTALPAANPGTVADDPRVVAAALTALVLGWAVMSGVLLEATGLEDIDDERMLDALVELELRLMTGAT